MDVPISTKFTTKNDVLNKTDTNWIKNPKSGVVKVQMISESVESNDPTISTMLHKARVESIRQEE